MNNKTSNKQSPVIAASATYKGCVLRLAKGKNNPVILVINHNMTERPDGVLDVVATPRLAKMAVDRRLKTADKTRKIEKRNRIRKDSKRILQEGDGESLAAAMMG